MSNFIVYGSSPITGAELPNSKYSFTAIIAERLGMEYVCNGKPVTSNHKISRKVLEYAYQPNDFVFVLWTAPNRYELRNENGWTGFTVNSKATSGVVKEWIDGPGRYEYTELYTTLESMVITQSFLIENNIPYIFSADNSSVMQSYLFNNPDRYIKSLKNIIKWDKFYNFSGKGFIDWAKTNNYPFIGTHAGVEAHQHAADYVLTNWQEAF